MAEDKEPAPYQRSRAALREKFGARSIYAGNRQSSADTTPSGIARREGAAFDDTPSGRARSARQSGMMVDGEYVANPSENQIVGQDNAQWRSQFGPLPERQLQTPMDFFRSRAQPTPLSPLQAIREARGAGATNGTFNVPQYGGSAGFSTASASQPTMPLAPDMPEDITAMLDLIGTTPLVNSSGLGASSMAARSRKSVLDSASKWVVPI
jgi:hypothetical protein